MFWILQDNLINAETRDQLVGMLSSRQTAFAKVRLVPFFNQLEGEVPQVEGPVFVYGSTGLGYVAKKVGWTPGYVDQNLDYELMLSAYGNMALNHGAVCCTIADMQHRDDRFFLRPVLDTKSFAGTVMSWDEFETFRTNLSRIGEGEEATLRPSDRIVAAPLTSILAEYRFFVIAGHVVTGSRYKSGDLVRSSPEVPREVAHFAQNCVDIWRPNDAFTIDIAITPDGPKVIELNSANSAGFYACDQGAIIDAVNRLA